MPDSNTSQPQPIIVNAKGSLWWLLQWRILIDVFLIGGASLVAFTLPAFPFGNLTLTAFATLAWMPLAKLCGIAIVILSACSTSRFARRMTVISLSLFMIAMTQCMTISIWLPWFSDSQTHEIRDVFHPTWLVGFAFSMWALGSLGLLWGEQKLLKNQIDIANEHKWSKIQIVKRALLSPLVTVLVVGTVIGIAMGGNYLVESTRSLTWSKVEGQAIEVEANGPGALTVRYEYEIDGCEYDGSTLTTVYQAGGLNKVLDSNAKSPALKVGNSVAVFYNPSYPSQSVLEFGPTNFGLLFYWAGLYNLGLLLTVWQKLNQSHVHRIKLFDRPLAYNGRYHKLSIGLSLGLVGFIAFHLLNMVSLPIDPSSIILVGLIALLYRICNKVPTNQPEVVELSLASLANPATN